MTIDSAAPADTELKGRSNDDDEPELSLPVPESKQELTEIAAQGIQEALHRYERFVGQIDENLHDFEAMMARVQDKYVAQMLDVKEQARGFMTQSIASWVAASDETQEVALQLKGSKALVARFSDAVSSRSYKMAGAEGSEA